MTNKLHTIIIGSILAACATFTVGMSWAGLDDQASTSPDVTVAPCSAWGPNLDQVATLKPYTYTDRCMDESTMTIVKNDNLKSVIDFGN